MTRKSKVTRRRALQALGAGTAASLAGCGGSNNTGDGGDGGTGGDGGDGGANQLGERVPAIVTEYWSNLPGTTKPFEDMMPTIREGVESLGVSLQVKPVDFTTQISNNFNDKRTHHLSCWSYINTPTRLDPHQFTRFYAADWAGANGRANPTNYANCEQTLPAVRQANASSEEERRRLVNEAQQVQSEDAVTINISPYPISGAIRTDLLDVNRVGEAGLSRQNPNVFIASSPKDGSQMVAQTTPTLLETVNFPTISDTSPLGIWNHLVHTTLTEYDHNYELQNVLAEDYEITDNGRRIEVSLRDATFHNGDTITAEDVKFTFEYLAANASIFPNVTKPPYESIKTLDEKTVQFNFTQPFLPMVSRVWPRWGILHKETWEQAEDPGNFTPDPMIGSGPFAVDSYELGQTLSLVPHDGHPVHKPNHDLTWRVFRETQTAVQSFKAGEVHVLAELAPTETHNIAESMGEQMVEIRESFTPFLLWPQCSWGPTQFTAFRDAVGTCLNRKQMVTLGLRGMVEPDTWATAMVGSHPWRPPNENLHQFTDKLEGDVDAAKQKLSDAGWGWDDSGNLHFPPDADLAPVWPKGETPSPEEFPCLEKINS